METRHRDVTLGRKTPNCVNCSRSIEHTVCTVLHLLHGGWLIEQGLRSDYAQDTEQGRDLPK
jgi:hypothetical protein